MKTGWIKDNGKDYYLSNNGSMQTGYVTWGGNCIGQLLMAHGGAALLLP